MEHEYNTVEEALEDLKQGKIVLVTDDENRENEGDMICAAEFATQENINFMASYAKGLICTPMSVELAEKLGFVPMVTKNTDNHETAFTVSIDYKDTTTGISAAERGLTMRMCVDENVSPEDFRKPGHVFPLIAKNGGVLVRNGHTEATVDLMRLAGLKEMGLCCEIMKEDGTMARFDDLQLLAKELDMKMISIEDLQKYIKMNEQLMTVSVRAKMPTGSGVFEIVGFENNLDGKEHIALVKGDVAGKEDVLVRLHSECFTGDILGSLRCDCGSQLKRAMRRVDEEGEGVVLYLRQEGRGIGLLNKLKAYTLQDQGADTVEANVALGFDPDMRDYAVAVQMLKALGVKSVRVMTNNPAKIEALEDYGMKVTGREAIETGFNETNEKYMKTKKEKMRHMLTKI